MLNFMLFCFLILSFWSFQMQTTNQLNVLLVGHAAVASHDLIQGSTKNNLQGGGLNTRPLSQ